MTTFFTMRLALIFSLQSRATLVTDIVSHNYCSAGCWNSKRRGSRRRRYPIMCWCAIEPDTAYLMVSALATHLEHFSPRYCVAIISLSYITYLLLMLFFYDIPSLCYNNLIYCRPCIFSPLRRCAISSSTTEVSFFTLLLRIRYIAYITL